MANITVLDILFCAISIFMQIWLYAHMLYALTITKRGLALLFGRAFEQTPQYWLNLQTAYDLKTAEASLGKLLNHVHSLGRV